MITSFGESNDYRYFISELTKINKQFHSDSWVIGAELAIEIGLF